MGQYACKRVLEVSLALYLRVLRRCLEGSRGGGYLGG